MVAAVYYFATEDDQANLLDYLGEPDRVTLHPWPVVGEPQVAWTRPEALESRQVMVVSEDFGPPVVIRQGDRAMAESTKAGVFNRLNWTRLSPQQPDGLVDSNRSPVLFWAVGEVSAATLHVNHIGSQADSMSAISKPYEQWVTRVMNWVRRKGTKVWGLECGELRPDLDIDLLFVNSVYALPCALRALESGSSGR